MSTEQMADDAVATPSGVPDNGHDNVLDRVLQRLDALERKVDALAAPTGSNGTALSHKLADEQVSAGLERLLDRLDSIERSVDLLGRISAKAHLIAEAAGDSTNFFFNEAAARGIDPIQRGQAAVALLEQASDPKAMELVGRLLAHADTASVAISALDAIDPADLETLSKHGVDALGRIAKLIETPEFQQLLDSGVFEPTTAGVVGSASHALVETRSQSIEAVGPIGAFFKMRDPDVQRAVGFTLQIAKRFGARLA